MQYKENVLCKTMLSKLLSKRFINFVYLDWLRFDLRK